MKEVLTKNPSTGGTLRQVALEPSDLAEMDRILKSHLEWLAIAQDFFPGSHHLEKITPEFYSMYNKIKDLQHFGVPTEIDEKEIN